MNGQDWIEKLLADIQGMEFPDREYSIVGTDVNPIETNAYVESVCRELDAIDRDDHYAVLTEFERRRPLFEEIRRKIARTKRSPRQGMFYKQEKSFAYFVRCMLTRDMRLRTGKPKAAKNLSNFSDECVANALRISKRQKEKWELRERRRNPQINTAATTRTLPDSEPADAPSVVKKTPRAVIPFPVSKKPASLRNVPWVFDPYRN